QTKYRILNQDNFAGATRKVHLKVLSELEGQLSHPNYLNLDIRKRYIKYWNSPVPAQL
ncbi:hypothetical protein ACJX0J_019595, partial [Zea mays]